jgi:uncharacterized membrane protein YphA (DoxX/SURF4 family)
MFDRRRYLGTFAVLSLVLLRLVVGSHFIREGTQKVEYDRHDGELRLAFTAEPFLLQAKGPLAALYHDHVPDDHGWRQTLATPRQNAPPTAEETAERANWSADYKRRQADANENGETAPFEFAPSTPYHEWATRIADDWRTTRDEVQRIAGLSDEQKQQAEAALQTRLQELSDYLAKQTDAITEYRHELWRLANWRESPEAGEVPFVEERIATKAAEVSGQPAAWVREVRTLEAKYHDDLREILTDEQRDLALTTTAMNNALADEREHRLEFINIVVTVLTIAVGVCLLLGFFTRLAAIVGALFLVGVIASQPPWLYDALPTMPNIIEFAALLVLAGTGAGRWLGLDFFTYALFHRFRRRDEVVA